MSNHPEIPGYYFVPRNTENLIELTFKERCILLRNQGNYTVNPDATLSDFERSDMACLLDNSRIPTHRNADAQLPADIAYGSVPIFTLRALPDFEEIKPADPIEMYLQNSEKGFISNLAFTIYTSLGIQEERGGDTATIVPGLRTIVFTSLLGYIAYSQGLNKISVRLQADLLKACELMDFSGSPESLIKRLQDILVRFTRMK